MRKINMSFRQNFRASVFRILGHTPKLNWWMDGLAGRNGILAGWCSSLGRSVAHEHVNEAAAGQRAS